MEDFFERFPHIIEKIFETLDDKSLTTCREVSTTWQKFIDERNLSWIRIVKIPKTLKHGNTYLHIAAQTGQTELLEMILDEHEDVEDKSPKNQRGLTPFHTACESGHLKTVEMLILNSSNFKIDFRAIV